MGFYPLESLPEQFSILWCLFPYDKGKNEPGPVARPTLVLEVEKNEELKVGRVLVAYGTGEDDDNSPFLDNGPDLVVDTWPAIKQLGLHRCPTRFSMSPRRRRWLAWSDKYFVPEPYRKGGAIVAGSLNPFQIARVKTCFRERGLDPFWD